MDLLMGCLSGNLSEADKKVLMDEGRCFYCKDKGVMIFLCCSTIDDISSMSFLLFPCTILKVVEHDTEDLTRPKRPVTDWPGPLARLRLPVRCLFSRAWPSPLWAYNTFSRIFYVLLNVLFILSLSIPFYSFLRL